LLASGAPVLGCFPLPLLCSCSVLDWNPFHGALSMALHEACLLGLPPWHDVCRMLESYCRFLRWFTVLRRRLICTRFLERSFVLFSAILPPLGLFPCSPFAAGSLRFARIQLRSIPSAPTRLSPPTLFVLFCFPPLLLLPSLHFPQQGLNDFRWSVRISRMPFFFIFCSRPRSASHLRFTTPWKFGS